jgi:hypothetical protein
MQAQGFEVELEGMCRAGGAVQSVSDGFGDIRGAATFNLALTPAAFGLLCSFFTPAATYLGTREGAGINALIEALERLASRAREACDEYRRADEDSAERWRGFDPSSPYRPLDPDGSRPPMPHLPPGPSQPRIPRYDPIQPDVRPAQYFPPRTDGGPDVIPA